RMRTGKGVRQWGVSRVKGTEKENPLFHDSIVTGKGPSRVSQGRLPAAARRSSICRTFTRCFSPFTSLCPIMDRIESRIFLAQPDCQRSSGSPSSPVRRSDRARSHFLRSARPEPLFSVHGGGRLAAQLGGRFRGFSLGRPLRPGGVCGLDRAGRSLVLGLAAVLAAPDRESRQ